MRTLISKFTGRVPTVVLAVCLFQVTIAAAVSGASIDIVKASHQLNSGPVLKTGMNAELLLRFTNDSGHKLNCSHAWKLSSPDGCVWDSSTIMEVGTWPSGPFPFKDLFDIEFTTGKCGTGGTGADTLYLIAVGSDADPSKQMPDGWNDSGIVVTAWFHERSQGGKHICIDSCSCPPSAIWKWSAAGVSPDVVPEFKGIAGQPYTPGYGYCFELQDECPLAPVVLNTGGMVSEPYVDPNLQGNVCTTLSYDFDSYDAC